MISQKLFRSFYPDNSKDGTIKFYGWIGEHIDKSSLILNLGAGSFADDPIRCFKGKVAKVVGADIDPELINNKDLEEVYVIDNNCLPFEDNMFDLV